MKRDRLKTDPKTGKRTVRKRVVRYYWSEALASMHKDKIFGFFQEYVSEDTELRKKLLEEIFVDLVKKHYVEAYLETKPETASRDGYIEFIKKEFAVELKETTAAIFRGKRFMVIEGFGSRYSVAFEYKDEQLVYENIYSDAVFDEVWDDMNLIMEFVRKHIGSISKERAKLFRQYLMEDANDYPNSNDLKQQIKEIFLRFDIEELKRQVEEDILEEMKEKHGASQGLEALELYTKERVSSMFAGISPYEDPRQTLIQPFAEQYGVKLWTTLYEKAPLPDKGREQIRKFLMMNFYELFIQLVPYEILHSKKLEEGIAAKNKNAIEFKRLVTELLDSLGGSLLITKGGYGNASYLVTKENLSMLYSDELALKEIYEKHPSNMELIELFKKMYRWTKDLDEKIELGEALRKRKDKALKRYLYSYEEELSQKDIQPRGLLKKIPVDIETQEILRESC